MQIGSMKIKQIADIHCSHEKLAEKLECVGNERYVPIALLWFLCHVVCLMQMHVVPGNHFSWTPDDLQTAGVVFEGDTKNLGVEKGWVGSVYPSAPRQVRTTVDRHEWPKQLQLSQINRTNSILNANNIGNQPYHVALNWLPGHHSWGTSAANAGGDRFYWLSIEQLMSD